MYVSSPGIESGMPEERQSRRADLLTVLAGQRGDDGTLGDEPAVHSVTHRDFEVTVLVVGFDPLEPLFALQDVYPFGLLLGEADHVVARLLFAPGVGDLLGHVVECVLISVARPLGELRLVYLVTRLLR